MQIICPTQIEPNTDVKSEVNFSDYERIETLKKFYPEWTEEQLNSIVFLYSKCNSAEEIEKRFQDERKRKEEYKREEQNRKWREEKKRRSDLIKSAKIPNIFTSARAADFIITDNNETTAKTAIKSITDNSGLFIYGECGTGKTMLASIIANERAEIFKPSMFIRAIDIFFELNPFFAQDKNAPIRKRHIIHTTPCLIIDDLGAEKPSDFTRAILFDILDHRMNENLQTIITTNFNINELKDRLNSSEELKLSDKIIRRITDTCQLVELHHY